MGLSIDREKVIKGLETCKSSDKTCSDCPLIKKLYKALNDDIEGR